MKATSIRLMKNSPRDQALMRNTLLATKSTPAARPSMLSRRLKALVTPTIHTTVTPTLSASWGRKEMRTPAAMSISAARSCPPNFTPTGKRLPRMSSARPTAKMRLPPARIARSRLLTRYASWSMDSDESKVACTQPSRCRVGARSEPARTTAVNETKTAKPPSRGIGCAWTLRWPGSSMTPKRRARARLGGTSAAHRTAVEVITSTASRTWSIPPSGGRRRARQQLPVERVDVVDEPPRGMVGEHVGLSLPHSRAEGVAPAQRVDASGRERGGIPRRNEKAAPPVAEQIGRAADARRHHRTPRGQGLDERHRGPFVARAVHDHVQVAVHGRHVAAPAVEEHALLQAQPGALGLERPPLLAVTDHREPGRRHLGAHRRRRAQERAHVLDRGQPTDDADQGSVAGHAGLAAQRAARQRTRERLEVEAEGDDADLRRGRD